MPSYQTYQLVVDASFSPLLLYHLLYPQSTLYLGNLDAKRDWGHARDYIEGMWLILQQEVADDFVLATNETHTVREYVEKAFAHVGTKVQWRGEGVDEVGVDAANPDHVLVAIDAAYFRPTEVDLLWGDCTKAMTKLGEKCW